MAKGSGTMFNRLRFLCMLPDGVSIMCDFEVHAGCRTLPGTFCWSELTTTFDPLGFQIALWLLVDSQSLLSVSL